MKLGINASYRGPLPPHEIDQIASWSPTPMGITVRAAVQTVAEAQSVIDCCAGKVRVLLLIERVNDLLLLAVAPMKGYAAIHLGNEVNMGWPEPSPNNCSPKVFEEWIHFARGRLRLDGFDGDILAGSVCDLRQWSLDYLTAANVKDWPADVVVTFSRYSADSWTQDPVPAHTGYSRTDEGVKLRACIGPDRHIACSEFGAHYARQKRTKWLFWSQQTQLDENQGAQYDDVDLQFLESMGCVLSCKYQWQDGPGEWEPEHRRGVQRQDELKTLRPTADILKRWASKGAI